MKKTFFGLAAIVAIALPAYALAPVDSGLAVGDMTSAFEPTHVSGPDAGTNTCPVCKYGNAPAVQVWAQMGDSENTAALAKSLDASVKNSKAGLKAFVMNMTECDMCVTKTTNMAKEVKLANVGITYIGKDSDATKLYKINTASEVKNTVLVYKDRKVVAKFVNLKADKEGLSKLNAAIATVNK